MGRKRWLPALAVTTAAFFALGGEGAALADIGFQDQSFSGTTSPTGTKRSESVLWWNDGFWWASMWHTGSGDFHIFKLNTGTQTWSDTGTALDTRSETHADVLWDGARLYVASHLFVNDESAAVSGSPSHLFRYSYNPATDRYSLDSGFPATINNYRTETLAIDKDSTGKLWATWQQGNRIYVNRTVGSDNAWGTPFVLPVSGSSVTVDDNSAIVAFGGNKIGVMWSNLGGSGAGMYFAVHRDGQPDTTWDPSRTAVSGASASDDHINLKALSNGRVVAATKTSYSSSSQPLSLLLVRDAATGNWSNYTIARVSDCPNRPIVVVDEQQAVIHVFETAPAPPSFSCNAGGGAIYEKTSPLNPISFSSGKGKLVMLDSDSAKLHNVSSTKQVVSRTTGLTAIAANLSTRRYWHHFDPLGTGPPPDTTPPDTTIGSGPSGTVSSASASFSFSSTESGSTFECSLEGAAFSSCTSPKSYSGLSQGSHTFQVRAIDAATNPDPTPASRTWTVDTIAPTVSSVAPAEGAGGVALDANVRATFSEALDPATVTTGNLTLVRASDGATVPATVSYDGATRTAVLDPSADLGPSTSYTATVTTGVKDQAGNALGAAKIWSFTTAAPPPDATPPDTTIDSGPSGTVSSASASFSFSSTEPGSSFECSLDRAGFSSCTSPQPYNDLPEGSHTFQVRAIDAATNPDPTPASRTWIVDTIAPTVSSVAPADGATEVALNANVQATFSEDLDPATVTTSTFMLIRTLDGAPVAATVTYDAASKTAVLDPSADLLLATSYTAIVTTGVKDQAGNALGAAKVWSFDTTATPPADTTPPDTTIDSGPSGTVNSSSASFSFSSTELGSTFECSLDGAGFTLCTSPQPYNDLPEGSHTFQVRAIDAATNPDPTPASRTWIVDTIAPTVSSVAPADGATEVALTANVQANFSEDLDPASVTTSTFTLVRASDGATVPATVSYDAVNRRATLDPSADLGPSTSYTATVTTGVKDQAGNAPGADTVWSFTTGAPPPPSGIKRESTTTVVNSTATSSVTIAKPFGTAAGDVLVSCLALNGANVAGAAAGWTPIASVTSIANPRTFGYYRVAGPFEPASYTWMLGSSVASGAGIARYSGVDNSTPLDAAARTVSGASATSGTVPGVSTATANAMLIGCMALNSSSTALTIASPSGTSEAWDIGGKRHEFADGLQAAPGASGDKTWTFSAGREWAGWLTALRAK